MINVGKFVKWPLVLAFVVGACGEEGTPCSSNCADVGGTWQAVLTEDLDRCVGWRLYEGQFLMEIDQDGSELRAEFGTLAVLTGTLYDDASFSVSSTEPVKDPENNATADVTITGTFQGNSMTAKLDVRLRDRTEEGKTEENCSMSGDLEATRQ